MLKSISTVLFGGALVCACVATDWKDNTPTCLPATTLTGCICPTGNFGYQVCSVDGLSYSACLCGAPPADGGMTVDGGIESDAASPDAADDASEPVDAPQTETHDDVEPQGSDAGMTDIVGDEED